MELIDPAPHCFLTRAKFLKINEESIALGLSRTLPDEWLPAVNAVVPIKGAWLHRSCKGQYCVRLEGGTNCSCGTYPWPDGRRSRARRWPSRGRL